MMTAPFYHRAPARLGALVGVADILVCACPRCQSIDIWPEFTDAEDGYGMYCKGCNWTGPLVAPEAEPDLAIAAWNRECGQIRQAQKLGLAVNLYPEDAVADDAAE